MMRQQHISKKIRRGNLEESFLQKYNIFIDKNTDTNKSSSQNRLVHSYKDVFAPQKLKENFLESKLERLPCNMTDTDMLLYSTC